MKHDYTVLKAFLPMWSLANRFMHESARWLTQKGYKEQAKNITFKTAKMNNFVCEEGKFPDISKGDVNDSELIDKENDIVHYTLADIFRTPGLRVNALILAFNQWLLFTTMNICGIALISAGFTGLEIASIILIVLAKCAVAMAFDVSTTCAVEIFPTPLRNIGYGFVNFICYCGGIIAPYIVLLVNISPSLPYVIMSSFTVISGFSILLLPETLNVPLPETLDDVQGTYLSNWMKSKGKIVKSKEEHIALLEDGVNR
ncbi:organic cation transporter protein-like [Glandiceps talaboti]